MTDVPEDAVEVLKRIQERCSRIVSPRYTSAEIVTEALQDFEGKLISMENQIEEYDGQQSNNHLLG